MQVSDYRSVSNFTAGDEPRSSIRLAEFATDQTGGFSKHEAKKQTKELIAELQGLQEKLFAQSKHRVLVVLQAIDAGGKDGTIDKVFGPLNANGVNVHGFKAPSEEELAHDYLWRVHEWVPGNGQMTVFNRSHYEDVLVVRVRDFVSEERWSRRYRHIREFERMLTDEGTTIVKFFLTISKDEQKQRFEDRLHDPEKQWKFRVGDLGDRALWDDYQAAFQAMLDETSDPIPWWVIPSDRKWFRTRLVAQIMVDTLKGLGLEYPPPEEGLDTVTID